METQLRQGARALGVELGEEQVQRLLGYAALLKKWGGIYNLTALRSDEEIVSHHLLDSLAVVRPVRSRGLPAGTRILDVGSGAGLPGAVLAIACPEIAVDCLDAVAKKAAFVQQAAASLRLPNLRGLHRRVESVEETYPLVTSRAFASLADFAGLSSAALAGGGVWMAMKGKFPADEVAGLPLAVEMFHVEQLQVPGLGAERCLVWMRRRGG